MKKHLLILLLSASIAPGAEIRPISSSGGDALVANPLSQFAATTSAQLASVLSDENGTGKILLADGTISIATGKTLTASNTLTFTGTDGSSVNVGTGGTVMMLGGTQTVTGDKTFTGAITIGQFVDLFIPSSAGAAPLTSGEIHLDTTNRQLGIHNGTREVAIPLIHHFAITFDPKAVCDGTIDRLFLMSTWVNAPFGIKVIQWKISCEADPTTELDIDLKRADAFIGVANSAVMDVLDTTAGAASESTAANINGDAVVANNKVLYLEFGAAYTETGHQVIFEMFYETEED